MRDFAQINGNDLRLRHHYWKYRKM